MRSFSQFPTNAVYVHHNVGVGLALKYNFICFGFSFATCLRPTLCGSFATHLFHKLTKPVDGWFARVGLKHTSTQILNHTILQLIKRPTPTGVNVQFTFEGNV